VLGTVVLSGQNSGLHQFVRLHRQVREGKLSAVAVPMVNPITGK
jgi:acyl-[acyl carrier protein]--UDP-N-acetylglucosamine O-acyltransferase